MGLQECFKIFPETNETNTKMQEASIFVLVSATEAFPMVLLEAMVAKSPIISYDSPHGPANIVSDEVDGIIVPLNNKLIFSEKLTFLIENPEYRDYFVNNQKLKINQFSQKVVMEKWNHLICNILKK
jgi:glycosyltransferase involved in cell wall biosynthesis